MGACPEYINDLLRLNRSQHSKNTRDANLLYYLQDTIERRTIDGGRTFSVMTSKCLNHLPLELRTSPSVNILKKRIV